MGKTEREKGGKDKGREGTKEHLIFPLQVEREKIGLRKEGDETGKRRGESQ